MPVELAEDHGGLGGCILGQVVARQLIAGGRVDDSDERLADLSEGLAMLVGFVDGNRENDALDLCRHCRQIDRDRLVVADTFAGQVVTRMLDRTVRRALVAIEDEVTVTQDLLVDFHADRRSVEVERGTIGGTQIPTQANNDLGECAAGFLREIDISALGQAHCHVSTFHCVATATDW